MIGAKCWITILVSKIVSERRIALAARVELLLLSSPRNDAMTATAACPVTEMMSPAIGYPAVPEGVPTFSIYDDWEREAAEFKWIESEKAGCDLGEECLRRWVREHWWGYLRARWVEHLQGLRFWLELDRGDFGLLKREFHEDAILRDCILDRLKSGQENLHIIEWAIECQIPMEPVMQILRALDINSRRLVNRFHTF